MYLYFIRHGETDWNTVRRLQGGSDIPLNEQGIRLAQMTAEAMKDIPFHRIFTSPLIRAKETARIIKGDRDIPVIEDQRLREISFGVLEGKIYNPQKGIVEAPQLEKFFEHPEQYQCPEEGESIPHLLERTADFLQELVHTPSFEEETILISCHGAALRGLLASVKHVELKDFWKGGVHKNCAVSILEAHHGVITILEEGKMYYESYKTGNCRDL